MGYDPRYLHRSLEHGLQNIEAGREAMAHTCTTRLCAGRWPNDSGHAMLCVSRNSAAPPQAQDANPYAGASHAGECSYTYPVRT